MNFEQTLEGIAVDVRKITGGKDVNEVALHDLTHSSHEYFSKLTRPGISPPLFILQEHSPLILIAPHAAPHWRTEDSIRTFVETTDDLTAGIALALGLKLECSVLIATGPNEEWAETWDSRGDDFKRLIDRFVNRNSPIVIDLHGFDEHKPGAERDFILDIGTGVGELSSKIGKDLQEKLRQLLPEKKQDIELNRNFTAKKPHTVTSYVQTKKRPAPCIQVEMSRAFREDPEDLEALFRAVEHLHAVPEAFKGQPHIDIRERTAGKKASFSLQVTLRASRAEFSNYAWTLGALDPEDANEFSVHQAKSDITLNPDEIVIRSGSIPGLTSSAAPAHCLISRLSDSGEVAVGCFRVLEVSKPHVRPNEIYMHEYARNLLGLRVNDAVNVTTLPWDPRRISGFKTVRSRLNSFGRACLIGIAGAPVLEAKVCPTPKGSPLDGRRDVAMPTEALELVGVQSGQQVVVEFLGQRQTVTVYARPSNEPVEQRCLEIYVPQDLRNALQAPIGSVVNVSRSMSSLVWNSAFLTGATVGATFFGAFQILSVTAPNFPWWSWLTIILSALGSGAVALFLRVYSHRMRKSSALSLRNGSRLRTKDRHDLC